MKSFLAGALSTLIVTAVACGGSSGGSTPEVQPSCEDESGPSTATRVAALGPTPTAVSGLLELALSGRQVTETLRALDPSAPEYEESSSLGWVTDPSDGCLEEPLRSFVMLDRYAEAGLIVAARNGYSSTGSGVPVPPDWPFGIMSGIARYENADGAKTALELGPRLYGLGGSSVMADPAHAGAEITRVAAEHAGDHTVIHGVDAGTGGPIISVSVQVDDHIGTIVVQYTNEAPDVTEHARALALALADNLRSAG